MRKAVKKRTSKTEHDDGISLYQQNLILNDNRKEDDNDGIVVKRRRKIHEDDGKKQQRISLFHLVPDEIVMMILSFGTLLDIQCTRGWQSKMVRKYTETRNMIDAAKNDNLDNMIWIYEYIYKPIYASSYLGMNCTGT